MGVSKRADILNDVITMLESITIANGFQTDVAKVTRGIVSWEKTKGNRPFLAIINTNGPRVDISQGGYGQRDLEVHIWGYVEVDGYNDDFSSLDKLLADVEKAMMTPVWNTVATPEWTTIDNIAVYEGGFDQGAAAFDMTVTMRYIYAWDDP